MKQGDVKAILDGYAEETGRQVKTYVQAEIAALEERLSAPAVASSSKAVLDAYEGIWRPGTYPAGTLVSDKSSLWLALEENAVRPGEGTGWRLVSKRGEPPQ